MELILHNSWKTLCDYEFKAKEKLVPKSGVVFCHTDDLFDFFRTVRGLKEKYILVSADSDFGIEYQEPDTVSSDILKWARFISPNFVKGYDPLIILPRCNVNQCRITDTFCKKIYSFTKDTIDELLPDNVVLWLGTNINVSCGRTIKIPFGISPETAKHLKYLPQRDSKSDNIYCNFQLNTIERYELLSHLKYFDNVDIQATVSHEQYAEEVMKHKYILCPEGNGHDSYRILEAIYSNSIPIINDDYWSEAYDDLPVIKVPMNDINEILKVSRLTPVSENLQKADLNYWRNLLKEKRLELCV